MIVMHTIQIVRTAMAPNFRLIMDKNPGKILDADCYATGFIAMAIIAAMESGASFEDGQEILEALNVYREAEYWIDLENLGCYVRNG